MSQAKRIILNASALYFRSLFTLFLSLFSARWVLEALGAADFGLYGVIGSSVLLVTFLSAGMSVGVSRFYAYAIGQGQGMNEDVGKSHLIKWFNTAFAIHSLIALSILFIGYPLGSHAVYHWLTIPADRLDACHMVLILALITTSLTIWTTPFVAFYDAHQDIAELSLYGLITSLVTCAGAYALLHVESDRLVAYAILMGGTSCICRVIQIVRCCYKYSCCRLVPGYLLNIQYLRELFSYVGWKMFGMSCVVFRLQGTPVLVNLFMGPLMNAAYSVANRVYAQSENLSAAMNTAFQPAVITLEGKGSRMHMLSTALKASKYGTVMMLLIALPMTIEIESVLKLWLVNPPAYAGTICKYLLVALAIDKMTSGQMMAVNAVGRIKHYEFVQGALLLSNLPLLALLLHYGMGAEGIGISMLTSMASYCGGRLFFARHLTGMQITPWFKQVAVPVILLSVVALATNLGIAHAIPATIFRVPLTIAVDASIIISFAWLLMLKDDEKQHALALVRGFRNKFLAQFTTT